LGQIILQTLLVGSIFNVAFNPTWQMACVTLAILAVLAYRELIHFGKERQVALMNAALEELRKEDARLQGEINAINAAQLLGAQKTFL